MWPDPLSARARVGLRCALCAGWLALLLAACSRSPVPSPRPMPPGAAPVDEPAPAPIVERRPPLVVPVDAAPVARPAGASAELPPDPILSSPASGDEDILRRMDRWRRYWRGRGAGDLRRALERMGRYEGLIDRELEARGLPRSLRYLPVIESEYHPLARSQVGAAGLWQFMPETARWLGLEVTPVVDHRLDPFRATPKALDYLQELRGRFDSWFLALAAYNSGPNRIARLLREIGSPPLNDDVFRRIRARLPEETRDFIPKYLAAAQVAQDPAAIGLEDAAKHPPLVFDSVWVQGAASLDVISQVVRSSEDRVRLLNPHLLLELTPAGRSTSVRVPVGAHAGFAERFAAVPPESRVTLSEHRVQPGETLSHVARDYRVSVAALRGANPNVEPRRMQVGTRLVIPRSRPAGFHVVERGESLWLIARDHKVDLEQLRRFNNLDQEARVRAGDLVKIPGSR